MSTTVKRAGAFAILGSSSLAAPVFGPPGAIAPFVLLAIYALTADRSVPGFELLARPGDFEGGRLYGLAGFALAAAGLGLLTLFGLPLAVFTSTICLLVFGNFVEHALPADRVDEFGRTTGFVGGGMLAGAAAWLLATWLVSGTMESLALVVFFVTVGSLVAALLRSVLFKRDDPVVLLTVGLIIWLFVGLGIETGATAVAVAIVVTAALGYVSYALETASIPGLLTGVLLGLVTIVLGGFGWFAILIAFFGIGGLATKYRYDEKAIRGVAEENEGARGTGNVLSNSAVALVAVIGYSASPEPVALPSAVFLFAFTGALATALGDTLSSEIGCIFDRPRLITTFEGVEPGTNGGVTWQGTLAGVVGAGIVGGLAVLVFEGVGAEGAGIIALAGIIGMFVDSLLGAIVEGRWVGNQAVNFLATLSGALIGIGLAVIVGLFAF